MTKTGWSSAGRLIAPTVMLLLASTAFAQAPDPIVGTWNVSGNAGGTPDIAILTFNQGGTTVEVDTAGTNSSASPGESADLGTWKSTGKGNYQFKQQNYDYDSAGNLSALTVASCKASLSNHNQALSGTCKVSSYTCTVSQCPGSLLVPPISDQFTATPF